MSYRFFLFFIIFLLLITPCFADIGEHFYADGTNTLENSRNIEFEDGHAINYDFTKGNKYVISRCSQEDDIIYFWGNTVNDALANIQTDFNFTGGGSYLLSITILQGDTEPEDLLYSYLSGIGSYSGSENICVVTPSGSIPVDDVCDATISLNDISGWDETLKTYGILIQVITPPNLDLEMSFKIKGQDLTESRLISKTGFTNFGDTVIPTYSTTDSLWQLPISSGKENDYTIEYYVDIPEQEYFKFTNLTTITGFNINTTSTAVLILDSSNNTVDTCERTDSGGDCYLSGRYSATTDYGILLEGSSGTSKIGILDGSTTRTYTRNIPYTNGAKVLDLSGVSSTLFSITGTPIKGIIYKNNGDLDVGMCILSKISDTNFQAFFQMNGETWYFKNLNSYDGVTYCDSDDHCVTFTGELCGIESLSYRYSRTNGLYNGIVGCSFSLMIGSGERCGGMLYTDQDPERGSFDNGVLGLCQYAGQLADNDYFLGSAFRTSIFHDGSSNVGVFEWQCDSDHTFDATPPATFFRGITGTAYFPTSSGLSASDSIGFATSDYYKPVVVYGANSFFDFNCSLFGTSIDLMKTYTITDKFIESLGFIQVEGGSRTTKDNGILKEDTEVIIYGLTSYPLLNITVTRDGVLVGSTTSGAGGYYELSVSANAIIGTHTIIASSVDNELTAIYNVASPEEVNKIEEDFDIYNSNFVLKHSNGTSCNSNNCLVNLGNELILEINGLVPGIPYDIEIQNSITTWNGNSIGTNYYKISEEDFTHIFSYYIVPTSSIGELILPVKDINYGSWNVILKSSLNRELARGIFSVDINTDAYYLNLTLDDVQIEDGYIGVDPYLETFKLNINSSLDNPVFVININFPSSSVEDLESGKTIITKSGTESGELNNYTISYDTKIHGYGLSIIDVQAYENPTSVGENNIRNPKYTNENSQSIVFRTIPESVIGITNIILREQDEIPPNGDVNTTTEFYFDEVNSIYTNVIDNHEIDIQTNGTTEVFINIYKVGDITNSTDPLIIYSKSIWTDEDLDNNDTLITLDINDVNCPVFDTFNEDLINLEKVKTEAIREGTTKQYCFNSITTSENCIQNIIPRNDVFNSNAKSLIVELATCPKLCVDIDKYGNVFTEEGTSFSIETDEELMRYLNFIDYIEDKVHCVFLTTGNYTLLARTSNGYKGNITYSTNSYITKDAVTYKVIMLFNKVKEIISNIQQTTDDVWKETIKDDWDGFVIFIRILLVFLIIIGFMFIYTKGEDLIKKGKKQSKRLFVVKGSGSRKSGIIGLSKKKKKSNKIWEFEG